MFDRSSLVVLGVVGAFTAGMVAGAKLDDIRRPSTTPVAAVAVAVPAPEPVAAPTPAPTRPVRLERVPTASAPAVQQQVKPLLNRGADTRIAAEGFGNARELMTVAYAARNTAIPFVLLKHRVLNERMSLASAIQKSRPELDAVAEVNRARAEARADLARLSDEAGE